MGFMASIKAQKAYALHGKGRIKEAAQMYEEAIQAGLDNPRYLLSYSVLLIRSGEYAKARDLLRKTEKAPGLTEDQKTQLFTNYAACMFRLGSIDKGISLLEKRHLRTPCGMIYQTLGYLYVEKFDPVNLPDFDAMDAESAKHYEEAVAQAREQAAAAGFEPVLPDAPVPAKDAYLAQKERASQFLAEALDYDDEDTICLDNMAQWHYRVLGDKEKARAYFDKAHELKDDQIDTLWFLSRYALDEGNKEKALEYLNKALDSRFSPLNFKSKADFEEEIARLNA